MGFFEDMERSLIEAIEMEKGNIPVVQRENMPAPTFVASDKENELIDELIRIRKEHSPFLKLFCSMVNALGYE